MTTRETRTERVVEQRSYGSQPLHNSRLDNNLDNLLEDLQNSVTRPITPSITNGSGLHAGNYREYNTSQRAISSGNTGGRNVETRVEYRSAANPITVPSESSTHLVERSKDGTKEKTIHKTIKYEYDVTDSILPDTSHRMQSNINQLDTLLDDLQQARKGANINAGIDPGFLDEAPGSTRQISKKTVQRELVYGSPEHQATLTKTTRSHQQSPTSIRRSDREGSVTRDIVYTVDDGTYGDIRQTRISSPSSQQQTLNKSQKTITTNVKNYNYVDSAPQNQVEIINPAILSDLDPNLLPNPNTKVTTTIKTYTYEIPGNTLPNTGYRVQSPTQDAITTNERYYTSTPNTINRNQTTIYKEENNKFYGTSPPPPVGYQTQIYKEDVRTTNKYGEFVPSQQPGTVIHQNETYNNTYGNSPSGNRYPRDDTPGGNTTIIHKTETYNNTYGGNSPNRYPPRDDIPRGNNYPPMNDYPRNYPPSPKSPDPINVTYKYTSEHKSSNKYSGYQPGSPYANDDRKPLLQPGKFPTEPSDVGPPKRLDDLMAQFPGDQRVSTNTNIYNTTTTRNERYTDENDSKQKLLSDNNKNGGPVQVTDAQKKKELKDLPKSKNVSGPPVYYPPGHEMFAKKEESAAAYSAQGGYMKASGKYEYEAESKSKSKSSSGAAVVPVCLPLCCAMPCVIL